MFSLKRDECPTCQGELVWEVEQWVCKDCQTVIRCAEKKHCKYVNKVTKST